MFVQMIRGTVRSASEAQGMFDRWTDEVRPGAIGWLGATSGVTPDGELVALVRFSSAEEAQRNSDRPEQGAWWEEMAERFTGPVTFHDCDDVAQILDGGRDTAGFVQVMEWSGGGSRSAAELAEMASRLVREHRPDVLGGLVAVARDGATIQAVYFTSEEQAREAESAPSPDEESAEMDRLMDEYGEPRYLDLPSPTLSSS